MSEGNCIWNPGHPVGKRMCDGGGDMDRAEVSGTHTHLCAEPEAQWKHLDRCKGAQELRRFGGEGGWGSTA